MCLFLLPWRQGEKNNLVQKSTLNIKVLYNLFMSTILY